MKKLLGIIFLLSIIVISALSINEINAQGLEDIPDYYLIPDPFFIPLDSEYSAEKKLEWLLAYDIFTSFIHDGEITLPLEAEPNYPFRNHPVNSRLVSMGIISLDDAYQFNIDISQAEAAYFTDISIEYGEEGKTNNQLAYEQLAKRSLDKANYFLEMKKHYSPPYPFHILS